MKVSEAIKILESKVVKSEENLKHFPKESQGYAANEARIIAYNIAINKLEQIDEPQGKKVEVPDFVAEWYEANKEDLEGNIFSITVDIYDEGAETDFEKWFYHCDTKPFETLIRMKDGYTVKPKRWVVKYLRHRCYYYFVEWASTDTFDPIGGPDLDYLKVAEFTDKSKAEAVATLVDGAVEEV